MTNTSQPGPAIGVAVGAAAGAVVGNVTGAVVGVGEGAVGAAKSMFKVLRSCAVTTKIPREPPAFCAMDG
jgi:hypothetical protein